MLRILLLFVAVVLAVPTSAADEPKAKPAEPAADKALDGTWVPVDGTVEGQRMPPNHLSSIKLILGNGKYSTVVGEGKEDGTYKVDMTKKPATIDITPTTGPNKGKVIPAIIEVDGDTMKVSYNLMGPDRPKDFTSTAANKFVVMTYKREKGRE